MDAAATNPTPSPRSSTTVAGLALGGAALLFAWPVLRSLVHVYDNNADYSHGFLVPIIALYAVHLNWARYCRLPVASTWAGVPAVCFGVVIIVLSRWYSVAMQPGGLGPQFLSALGLIACLAGISWSLAGRARTVAIAFSLVYLLFAVPVPLSWSLQLTVPLRSIVSALSAKLIAFIGIPVYQEGNLLHLAGHSLGVEDACSGIRSFWTLMASSVAIMYLMGGRAAQTLAVAAVSVPLAVAQNILRVVVTAILVNRGGVQFASGWRHELIGWATFVVAAAGVVAYALRLADRAEASGRETAATGRAATDEMRYHRVTVPVYGAILCLLLVGAAANGIVNGHYEKHYKIAASVLEGRTDLDQFPTRLGAFRAVDTRSLTDVERKLLDPSDYWAGVFEAPDGRRLTLVLMYWEPQRIRQDSALAGPHSPDVCYPAFGWQLDDTASGELPLPGAAGRTISMRLYGKMQERRWVAYWWHKILNDKALYIPRRIGERAAALLASWRRPGIEIGTQYSVLIDTEAGESSAVGRRLILDFAAALRPHLARYGLAETRLDRLSGPP